jgi:drug/metabolite transporter (DMT)-like permease
MHKQAKYLPYIIFVVLVIVWGSAYKMMKLALVSYTPLQTAALRITIAAIAMLPFALKHLPKIPKQYWLRLAITGFLGNGIPAILFMFALKKIDSNIGGIINALTPIWTLLIGILFFNKKSTLLKVIGISLGFVGVLILFLSKGNLQLQGIEYGVLILIATIFYGLNINYLEQKLHQVPSLYIGTISLLPVGFIYLILLLIGIDGKSVWQMPLYSQATVCIIILGIITTALCNILFFILIKRSNANLASLVTYFIPFVSIAIGYYYHEPIHWQAIVCFALILMGVVLVRKK